VRWVNAGHPPPILLRGTGDLESLPANGTPLGMLEEGEYSVAETRLEPGDRIVVFTDGLTEAQNPAGGFFGLKRLRETVRAHAGEDCQKLHTSVLTELAVFTRGAPQRDDVTLAVLEYRPD
jgi:serine phosphatase RsbU (regulator of sigma subunit)